MSTYTNTHTNHTDEVSKNWPINIPWSNNWDESQNPNPNSLNGDLLSELRQHAKALESNFDFADEDPNYNNVKDDELERGDRVDRSQMNEQDGSLTLGGKGLLDGLKTIKSDTSVDPESIGNKVTRQQLGTIAGEIENLSNYSNYTNYNDSGYGQYSAYSAYSREAYINYGRYNEYNRFAHFDGDNDSSRYQNYRRSHRNVYTNQTAPGYNNGSYNNNSVQYSNSKYSDNFNNPATYQNTL